jgi:hypothetical protein
MHHSQKIPDQVIETAHFFWRLLPDDGGKATSTSNNKLWIFIAVGGKTKVIKRGLEPTVSKLLASAEQL